MATQQEIDAVKIHLPDEAVELGIDDAIITSWLDGGFTQTKTVLSAWRAIAAKTVGVEDVSESGSSRTNNIHDRAMAMILDWQQRADAEDAATGALPPKGHIHFHTITRV